MKTVKVIPPYLIFVGNEANITYAKTGAGMVYWRPELCKGQIGLSDGCIDLGIPAMTFSQAKRAGVKSLLIGTASVGGEITEDWIGFFVEAMSHGLNIIGGVHQCLEKISRLHQAAKKFAVKLINVRVPPNNLPVASGKKRKRKRILTVGTDCAVGKKYTALCIERDMKKMGFNVDFRASGQTGIMIAGSGIPIDSVVSDFLSGAAELLSPDNKEDHWDVIEGQGGIFHPGYSSVSMGLLIGSQPDEFVVCHDAKRETIESWKVFKLPSIQDVINRTILIGMQTNPNIKCVGISVNTSKLNDQETEIYLNKLSQLHGVPAIDPIKHGTSKIISNLEI